jgi:hypothetical protein
LPKKDFLGRPFGPLRRFPDAVRAEAAKSMQLKDAYSKGPKFFKPLFLRSGAKGGISFGAWSQFSTETKALGVGEKDFLADLMGESGNQAQKNKP